MQREQSDNHKYLCWLDQIRYLGRKSIFAMLSAAADRTLLSDGLLLSGGSLLSGGFAFSEQDQSFDSALSSDSALSTGASFSSFSAGTESEEGHFHFLAAGAEVLYTSPESQLRYLCNEAFQTPARAEKAARLILKAREKEPERCEEDLARSGVSFCCFLEQGFPDRLRIIPDPPFGLYFLGNVPLFGEKTRTPLNSVLDAHSTLFPERPEDPATGKALQKAGASDRNHSESGGQIGEQPAAAIIGARLASGYGREQARRFARRLASRGITIISGMARGIDGIAQKAALDAGGRSYAVLGCGVDICYPEENRDLYDRLLQEGGIISEYPPGTYPEARLFPQRNRIISGLSDLVLVIEARKRSGTLITVDMALEQGREVYALPGRVSDSLSDGCNRLIRQGAGAATCPEDILEFFFGTGGSEPSETDKINQGRKHLTEQKMNSLECVTSGNPESGTGENCDPKGEAGENFNPKVEAKEKGDSEAETGEDCDQTGGTAGYCDSRGGTAGNFDPAERLSLEQGILRVLSREDETHVERLYEQISRYEEQGLLSAEHYSLSDVVTCLVRMKIDGRVEESSAGYYRRGGW